MFRAEPGGERRARLPEPREKVFDRSGAGVEADDDEEAALLPHEDGVLGIEGRERAGDAGNPLHRRDDRLQRLPPPGGRRARDPLDDEEDAVRERRPEPTLEVEADLLRLTGRHPRRHLEPLFDVLRSGSEDQDGDEPEERDRPAVAHDRGRPAGQRRA